MLRSFSFSGSVNDLKELTHKELKHFLTVQTPSPGLYTKSRDVVEREALQPLTRHELKALVKPQERRRSSLKEEKETFTFCNCSDRLKAYKNLFAACVSFIACFGSFLAILSLQSSINSEAGLGLASSALVYGTLIIASFFGPSYVKLIGTKYALISGYILFLLYTLCNYYPSWYTLIPGAILNGIGQPPIWIAIYAHVISVAIRYSSALKESPGNAISLFAGAVAASVKLAQVVGSLISSFILVGIEGGNSTGDTCNDSFGSPIKPGPIFYTLISTYVLVGIFGIIVAAVFMDHLGTDQEFLSPSKMCKNYLCKYIVVILKTLIDWKMLLILPLIIFNGIQLGFITGVFPKVICDIEPLTGSQTLAPPPK